VTVKSQIPDDDLLSQNMLQETMNVWCVHTTYCEDRIKLRAFSAPAVLIKCQ
jgi:hypothetical protein